MTVSFSLGRYLVALLGEWCFPLVIGIALGIGLSTFGSSTGTMIIMLPHYSFQQQQMKERNEHYFFL